MESFDIRIDKDGFWYYKGAHMFRKEILHVFFDHLKIDECGKYLIELGPERCYVDVEDTAFVVESVYKTKLPGDGRDQIEIILNDDSCEILEMNSLHTGRDNVLYCRVKKGKFTARFSRKSYYQLAEYIEESENESGFFIGLNGEKYFILETSIPKA
ncbi:MAG: DUF1285 domain-containing protein [Smithella sp.]|jgi:hypothetical protein